MIQQVYLWW